MDLDGCKEERQLMTYSEDFKKKKDNNKTNAHTLDSK